MATKIHVIQHTQHNTLYSSAIPTLSVNCVEAAGRGCRGQVGVVRLGFNHRGILSLHYQENNTGIPLKT